MRVIYFNIILVLVSVRELLIHNLSSVHCNVRTNITVARCSRGHFSPFPVHWVEINPSRHFSTIKFVTRIVAYSSALPLCFGSINAFVAFMAFSLSSSLPSSFVPLVLDLMPSISLACKSPLRVGGFSLESIRLLLSLSHRETV
ncbi:hypothetical protein CPB86DRAFT_259156 [Serendipita vermifera]|nr:hypothetical protein CPB86DRAFT_259156 [Serendipita vermifera]